MASNYERCQKYEKLLVRIYDNVRYLMDYKGITSAELEKGTGMSYESFRKFKYPKDIQFSSWGDNGYIMDYDMRITHLALIADYFEVPLEYLIGKNSDKLKALMTKREISALENKLKALKAQ